MSKILYRLNLVIASAPLVLTLIIFPFLPEMIPTNGVKTWSSKYSVTGIAALFLIPLVSLVVFRLMYWFAPMVYEGAVNKQFYTPKRYGIIVLSVMLLMVLFWTIPLAIIISNT